MRIWVLAALIALGIGLALCLPVRPSWAQEFGGCTATRSICAGPAVAITVGQFNLATSKFSGGLNPGVGYGLTYATDKWYATGLAGYLSFAVGGNEPNQAFPSLLLSFANYVRVGAGVSIRETDGPVLTQWRLLFGLGTDFGGSPRYLQTVVKPG